MINTKIVCTLGPATDDERVLERLILAGMNVARLNFSHSNHDEQRRRADMIKRLRKKLNKPIALMIDTKGPDIRLGKFEDNFAELFDGNEFILTTESVVGNASLASVSYNELPKKVEIGQKILLDDGQILLKVLRKTDTQIVTQVEVGGIIANNKSVNVPNCRLSIPFMRQNDINDIKFAIENDFDIIAASFVRNAGDLEDLRRLLKENTDKNSKIMIISKIENREGIDNIDEILQLSDGIMVARGDLGVEIDFEEIPSVQKYLIKKAHAAGKDCITATQMLESMIKNSRPTRAEITDVANSIYDGTSAIMLSGETAVGKHPVETVKTMVSIAKFTESDIDFRSRFERMAFKNEYCEVSDAVCMAAVALSHNIGAKAILAISLSGATTRMVAHFRPACPILGFTSNEKVFNQMALSWGVIPHFKVFFDDENDLFSTCISAAKSAKLIKKGDMIVVTAGYPLNLLGRTNNIRAIKVD